MVKLTPFKTSDEFFDWYIPMIEEFVPALKTYVLAGRHKAIVKRIPKLDSTQRDFMFKKIREITNVPDNVFFVYSPDFKTWASTYNKSKKRLEIIIPTYGFYMLRYPPVIEAAIQHEMGHILNRDFLVQISGHSQCINICMDCRINDQIDRQALKDLYDSTYYFKSKSYKSIVPEEFYPDIALPMLEGGAAYSWKTIHDYYHYNDADIENPQGATEPPETYVKDPVVGDIVQIRKRGEMEGKFGRVTAVKDGKASVEEMSRDEVEEHFDKLEDAKYNPSSTGSYTPSK
jgi:hypothetical protein